MVGLYRPHRMQSEQGSRVCLVAVLFGLSGLGRQMRAGAVATGLVAKLLLMAFCISS